MYVIDAVPLTALPRPQAQILSYFHDQLLAIGSVVEITLNHRLISAVVIAAKPLSGSKITFKKSVDFSLKDISRVVKAEPQVFAWQFRIAFFLSDYYYAPLGLCLKTILPSFWGKKKYGLESYNLKHKTLNSNTVSKSAVKFIPTNLANHHLDFSAEIKKHLAAGRQIFLLVPEILSAKYFLEKYAEFNPEFISSGLNSKAQHELWQKIANGQAQLIIGTRVGLFLPFKNLGLVIVDDEANEAYKSDMTPRYHAADLAIKIAELYSADLIFSATVPRAENYQKWKMGNLNPNSKIVNIVSEIRAGNFSIFSREIKEELIKVTNGQGKLILFIPRRGQAAFLSCQSCGQGFTCKNCSASLVLHNPITGRPALVCHHCGYQEPQPKNCPQCGGYKLKAIGIGIEKVVAELKKFFSYQNMALPPTIQLDSDSVNNEKAEIELIEKFQKWSAGILVTTQLVFSHKFLISAPVIGIINADTLINIPDFRSEESLFRQIVTLGQMAAPPRLSPRFGEAGGEAGKLIVQTYNPDDPAIKLGAAGKLKEFFDDELGNRQQFSYPPFARLIKITYRHKNNSTAAQASERLAYGLKQTIRQSGWSNDFRVLGPSPGFISRERGLYIWNILVKQIIPEIKKRNELLRLVSPGWTVDVDPRTAI